MADSKKVGTVTHFYDKISVGTVKLSGALKVGDKVQFKGKATDFTQSIESMQYEHQNVQEGALGQEVGVKVTSKVREGDEVYLVE